MQVLFSRYPIYFQQLTASAQRHFYYLAIASSSRNLPVALIVTYYFHCIFHQQLQLVADLGNAPN